MKIPRLVFATVAVLLSCLPMTARAEQLKANLLVSASIGGIVLDANGGALPNAQVKLTSSDGGVNRTAATDDNGRFLFAGLPAGEFTVTVTAEAMESFIHADIVLASGQKLQLAPAVLAVAGVTTLVCVSVPQAELAREQVKAAEEQRVLGVLPNFYSSYIWNAAPLSAGQKFDLALHASLDPVQFLGTAAVAGAEQVTNTYSGYGKGASGYRQTLRRGLYRRSAGGE